MGIVGAVKTGKKKGWDVFRELQNSPTCDLMRVTVTSSNAARGQKGTITAATVSGVAVRLIGYDNLPGPWQKLIDERGLIERGAMTFMFYAQAINDNEVIRYPASTGELYQAEAVDRTLETSQSIVMVLGAKRA